MCECACACACVGVGWESKHNSLPLACARVHSINPHQFEYEEGVCLLLFPLPPFRRVNRRRLRLPSMCCGGCGSLSHLDEFGLVLVSTGGCSRVVVLVVHLELVVIRRPRRRARRASTQKHPDAEHHPPPSTLLAFAPLLLARGRRRRARDDGTAAAALAL